MQRKKKSPEETRRQELLRELIKIDGIKTAAEARNLVKEMLGTLIVPLV